MLDLLENHDLTIHEIEREDAKRKRAKGWREVWRGSINCVAPAIVAIECPETKTLRRVSADVWDAVTVENSSN